MKATLEHLLPKLGINISEVVIIAHEGKTDLERSIPHKLRAWQTPGARFLILRDNDRAPDCTAVKKRLSSLVEITGKSELTKVRVVCQELEAWFLADLAALVAAGYLAPGTSPKFARRDPDTITHPVVEMQRLRRGYGKITGAAEIAPHLDPDNNRSASFRNTIAAIRDLTAA
jgi:hypothetical protein